MANFNIKAQQQNTYDAIVVGSGISGGWAAKELTEKGLKTLMLDKGRMVKHIEDYPTMNTDPWDHELRGSLSQEDREQMPVNAASNFANGLNKHFYANEIENPYTQDKPFNWIRGHQVGGKSLIWGKQTYRWSQIDFGANAKEGIGVEWPIGYEEIAPWYSYVEKFAGISGEALGLPQLPDSEFLPPMELNCVEKDLKGSIEANFPGRTLTIGRVAHLTKAINGRGKCQFRNRCDRGCPYGAYFSSNATTIPAAEMTGNLTIRPNSVVNSLIYDEAQGKATGVRVIDAVSGEMTEYYAKIIFLNASALSSTWILLNSTSDRFPNGFGNDSGQLGHNLMDHTFALGAMASVDGFEDQYYSGRRPNGIYIPRYRNISEETKTDKFLRGYGFQGRAIRTDWNRGAGSAEVGGDFKESLMKPGPWQMALFGFGEYLPDYENQVYLDKSKTDKWGQPVLAMSAELRSNELAMNKQIVEDAVEMLEVAGYKDIRGFDRNAPTGSGIHEMGTARMGKDPKTSVLNKFNQVHAAKNVFVTDGACMTSASCVNPSLTYMALTARAADYAVSELNKRNL